MFTYLIFDTNIWLYLANSKDPLTENFQEGYHFILLENILNKISEGAIKVVSNEIIQKEWERNKAATRDLVCKYEQRLENEIKILENIRISLKGKFDKELNQIRDAYKETLKAKIDENKLHISNVEKLLMSSSKFEIPDKVKVFASDWATEKKAPFTGKGKNSMADALILFSAIDFIKSQEAIFEFPDGDFNDIPRSIFISGNKNDFSSADNKDKIHDQLEEILDLVNMKYYISLPKALKRVDETLFADLELFSKMDAEMQDYLQEEDYCLECDVDPDRPISNYIHFYPPEEITNETIQPIDPNQLTLFADTPKTVKIISTIQRGFCNNCDAEHIKCQKCGAIMSDMYFDDVFNCVGCDIWYEVTSNYVGEGLFDENIKIVSEPSDHSDEGE
jgi:hypothetical protein